MKQMTEVGRQETDQIAKDGDSNQEDVHFRLHLFSVLCPLFF